MTTNVAGMRGIEPEKAASSYTLTSQSFCTYSDIHVTVMFYQLNTLDDTKMYWDHLLHGILQMWRLKLCFRASCLSLARPFIIC